ncbi:MAG: histidine--tRNA ligase [Zetaproteobacteria bacterium CG06_land_8_20_14_3_00_59_53]|nr:MAG: histidine--tRNA ligase [Zetaproteobacteria bacterium CG2_30_59_37]PIO89079.1 MAG: histidine--tRNA ligase [Zetaproteobacteria bacterium CG23_combo_of_CG06-09_8_20_14_all_59_86]PIQ65712.1 MAG: histidine--tRNA ligase [Zetaproteobacteria bacterium CG11_big_fil_rev_8_21_14_0_20_59_439]PIU70234.1 MAG: histidine--tRNA ligase [Zetaproteobacteria bacterium CG06_land_8_20_14_3_00_59_53]PIU96532.1 MAG: histidine--tRNA ligase [Zetaproteobacteria bacterium CG03_land_8_20_14_0_80_59_51]PIY46135.1 MA
MSTQFRSIRGIHDGLPEEVRSFRHIEETARRVFSRYVFSEVRLPVLEPTAMFVRSIGSDTDIVAKEMYRFEDRGGDDICLRPEGTAGAVRAYLQAGLTRSGAQRWFYIGPMFRRERPQKGRLRQFQQIGAEWFGVSGPVEDVEVLAMAHAFLEELGIPELAMEINSLGCPVCRPAYRDKLVAFLDARRVSLCETCNTRIDSNPMRVLDCKVGSCQAQLADAPEMASHLCGDCQSHFDGVKSGLDALAIPYVVNPRIVRGLDYYNRTAFEIVTNKLGAQGTVLAGGRYDGLVEELGGPATPAIGFAMGMERLAMLLPDIAAGSVDVAVVAIGDSVAAYALGIADRLRRAGCHVIHCGGGAAKRQFKVADREQARFVAVLGEDEMQQGLMQVKDMQSGSQQALGIDAAIAAIRQERS